MRVLVAAACLLTSCEVDHHVKLLLGPTEDTISGGFLCDDLENPGTLLVFRALGADSSTLSFNLVVDFVDLGGTFPSCLGEDVVTSCGSNTCTLATSDAPKRFCQPVTITNFKPKTDTLATDLINFAQTNFGQGTVFQHAPHEPVILRAVATLESCADIAPSTPPASGQWANLDPKQALGCAYSCPVSLDDATGNISLGLGFTVGSGSGSEAVTCNKAIEDCVAFPAVMLVPN